MMGSHLRAAATILAVCSLTRVSATNNTDTIQRSDGFQKFQTTMFNIQTNLSGLATAMADRNSTVDGLNSRLVNIEQSLEEVRKNLDDEAQRNSSEKTWNDGVLAQAIDMYNFTQQRIKSIREVLTERERNERVNAEVLTERERYERGNADVQECIAAIRNRDFKKADEKLNTIDDEFKTILMIREVYNGKTENFDLILSFALETTNVRRCFWVLKSLQFEMQAHNHDDPIMLINLIKAYNSEVIRHKKLEITEHRQAENLVQQLKRSVVLNYKKSLIASLRDGHGFLLKETKSIANSVYLFSEDWFSEVLEEAINEIYSSANKLNMVRAIRHLHGMHEIILALDVMMNKMKKEGHMNNPEILSVAIICYAMFSQDNYRNVSESKKTILTKVIDQLPTSAKSLAFASNHCIQSVEYNMSMYAATDYFKYDKFRRRVFGWIPGNQVENGVWAIERIHSENNMYYIRNKDFNEYLQASEKSYDEDRRNVFCWKEGGKVGAAIFAIELHGDDVYIKNQGFGEYLYMDIHYFRFNNDSREIFTWKPGGKDKKSIWRIVECN